MQIELTPQSTCCVICSSDKIRRFDASASDVRRPTFVHITECGNCHFAWQYPPGRSVSESVTHFDLNYKAQGKKISNYFNPSYKRDVASLELEFLSQLPISGKQLLDIGAGAGIFAELASASGYEVTALDPALEVERLEKIDRLRAIRGTLDDLPKGELFDAVTLWDVIEHMETPIKALTEARARLREGGWLVVETGNYKSAERVQGEREHWMYQLDHRWYFSPDSMTKLLSQLGFKEITYSQRVLRPGWSGNSVYPGPSYSQLLKSIIKNPLRSVRKTLNFMDLKIAQKWPLSGLGIFAVAARK